MRFKLGSVALVLLSSVAPAWAQVAAPPADATATNDGNEIIVLAQRPRIRAGVGRYPRLERTRKSSSGP